MADLQHHSPSEAKLHQLRDAVEAAEERLSAAEDDFRTWDNTRESAFIENGGPSEWLEQNFRYASDELTAAEDELAAAEAAYNRELGA